ncbi:hypothetical protein TTSV1_gp09 [Thermoproteus tenax spherical virus 1]|uniref:Uncharacterized protein n=1 Tax=Thermoproteus tenax spherical virus 1 TaxID=292639 RepID=Q647F3_9VIRU|nr:hypothetical protein TTSV1_gp09 [Thermoproteus tenax spherical virus 1]AAU25959.1 hypothetical protein [Thermoproteus tenax spherical virus 1]
MEPIDETVFFVDGLPIHAVLVGKKRLYLMTLLDGIYTWEYEVVVHGRSIKFNFLKFSFIDPYK